MHLHILGICGTFMAGVAEIAVQLGHRVTGSDANVYPPMSTFLRTRGITIHEGYDRAQFEPAPDIVVIGNALSRGNDAVEFVLENHLRYTSGAQWLADEVLHSRHVIAVSGTHGKTTTTSMLTFILREAGLEPGYLIGGIAQDFEQPAALGNGEYFVIEADEYDTAFFDKRSKFVHYRPDTLVINNLEFDHADIFADLGAIKTQFHHLLRTVPSTGLVIYPAADPAVADVFARGCWSRTLSFGFSEDADRQLAPGPDDRHFALSDPARAPLNVPCALLGRHNMQNTAAAVLAACEIGVPADHAARAAGHFGGVKRRLEVIGQPGGITIYDDFAHHPTAISATLRALRGTVGEGRVLCVLEPRSNTMRLGVHAQALGEALTGADAVFLYADDALGWDATTVLSRLGEQGVVADNIEDIVTAVHDIALPGDHVVIMSNGGFAGIHERILRVLERAES